MRTPTGSLTFKLQLYNIMSSGYKTYSFKKKKYGKRKYGSKYSLYSLNNAYRGPYKISAAEQMHDTIKKVIRWNLAATSTAGGVIAVNNVMNPSTANDWGDLQTCFKEYRILAVCVEYIPFHQNAVVSGIADGQLAMVFDRTSVVTALAGGLQDAMTYPGVKTGCTNQRFKICTKADGSNEMSWINMTNTGYWCSLRTYSSALSNSTAYGNFNIEVLCELRNLF